ncbi:MULTISPECIES: helicase RepA family protein [unclassified Burkholderia]|uniref:helicase RepA family protein n=1 Tax=unclassified Burkholderia TaxID=2613784 RepID=UPI002AAFC3AB|nr:MULTISPECIES: helicase RepA family protein [unclassified Burkholderia]
MGTDYIGDTVTDDAIRRSREQHAAEVARADFLVKRSAPVAAQGYRLQTANDLMNAPAQRWLVRGVIPAQGTVAMYGPSGSGKSFLVLDLCAAIAGGEDWFGYRVTPAPVVYIALEGEAGLSKRAKAWSARNHRPLPEGLHFVTQPFDVRNLADVSDLLEAVQAGGGAGLLVIDTLNRAAPGADENSSKDMGEIIAKLKILQDSIGGAVLVVHHTGKDAAKGLRGHSSLFAALDAALEVTRIDGRREWTVAKSKDDADGERYAFALRVVDLGEDEAGEPITSCVVAPDDSVAGVEHVKLPQGGNQRIAMDALAQPLRDSREFNKGDAPFGRPCLEIEPAVAIVAARLTCEPKRRNERARKAITGLVTRGIYAAKDGWLWRT